MSCIPLVSLVNTGNLHVLQAGEPGQQLSSRCLSVTVLKLLAQQLPAAHGFPGGSGGKESACNVGDPGMIRGWGRSPEEGKGQPTLNSCLENPVDRRAWRATVQGSDHRATQPPQFHDEIPHNKSPYLRAYVCV